MLVSCCVTHVADAMIAALKAALHARGDAIVRAHERMAAT
jgi:hypothetical protein